MPHNHVITFTAPMKAQLLVVDLPVPKGNEVLVEFYYSAISPGTEYLFFSREFPQDGLKDQTINLISKSTPLLCETQTSSNSSDQQHKPIQYGYCAVGKCVQFGIDIPPDIQEKLKDAWIFCFHPHSKYGCVPIDSCIPIPKGISPLDALFLPNTESALNFIHDAHPRMFESVAVVGCGILGALTCAILKLNSSLHVVSVDLCPKRVAMVESDVSICLSSKKIQYNNGPDINVSFDSLSSSSIKKALVPQTRDLSTEIGADCVIEVTGNPKGLDTALSLAANHSTVVIGSWYGNRCWAGVNQFGSARTHRSHIKLLFSQVSTLPACIRDRWTKDRRFQAVWSCLKTIHPHRYISQTVDPFTIDLTQLYLDLKTNTSSLQTVFCWKTLPTSE